MYAQANNYVIGTNGLCPVMLTGLGAANGLAAIRHVVVAAMSGLVRRCKPGTAVTAPASTVTTSAGSPGWSRRPGGAGLAGDRDQAVSLDSR